MPLRMCMPSCCSPLTRAIVTFPSHLTLGGCCCSYFEVLSRMFLQLHPLHQHMYSNLAVLQTVALLSQGLTDQATAATPTCYLKSELYALCRPSIMVQPGTTSLGQPLLSWATSTEQHQPLVCFWRRQMPAPSSTASCPCLS